MDPKASGAITSPSSASADEPFANKHGQHERHSDQASSTNARPTDDLGQSTAWLPTLDWPVEHPGRFLELGELTADPRAGPGGVWEVWDGRRRRSMWPGMEGTFDPVTRASPEERRLRTTNEGA